MAIIFDDTDREAKEIEWKDKYKSIKATGERIVGLIQGAKETITLLKAEITASTLFTEDEKTDCKDKLTARLIVIKADILAEFGL